MEGGDFQLAISGDFHMAIDTRAETTVNLGKRHNGITSME